MAAPAPAAIPTPVQQLAVIPESTRFAAATKSAAVKSAFVRGYRAAHEDLGKDLPSESEAASAAQGRLF